jgi:hypothetical protein
MSIESHSDRDFATAGVGNRAVAVIAAGLMAMMLGAVAMLIGFYVWQLPERALPPPRQLPAPQVRVDERALRAEIETEQRQRLTGYRWENPEKTLIGIPIERAMQIIAARGANAYDSLMAPSSSEQVSGPDSAAQMQTQGLRVPSNKEPLAAQKGARSP